MAAPRKYSDQQMIDALKECKGMVYLAADRIGCEADTIYNRAKVSRGVARAMRKERGKVVDTAELKLYQAILNGEAWAVQFSLKTIGKDRGYVERQEHDFGDGLTLGIKEVVDADDQPAGQGDPHPPQPGAGGIPQE